MKKALALLVVIVALSGCVGQPGTTSGTGAGVVITDFRPDSFEVMSGEPITFTLEVKNVGEADATEVVAELFGGIHEDSGWHFSPDTPARQTVASVLRGRGDLEGEENVVTWMVDSPAGLTINSPYDANARVYYKYAGTYQADLRFYSYDYLRSLPSEDFETLKDQAGVISQQGTEGPIGVQFSVGSRPLIVYGDDDSFTIQIEVTNLGEGNAFDEEFQITGMASMARSGNFVRILDSIFSGVTGLSVLPTGNIALPYEELNQIDITVNGGGLDMTCSGVDNLSDDITLIRGDSKTVFCTINNVDKDVIGTTKDYKLTVNLGYGYYADATSEIRVMKSGSPTSGTGGGTGSSTTNPLANPI